MATFRFSTLAKVLLVVLEISACGGFLLNDGDTLSSLCFPQDQICTCYDNEYSENTIIIDTLSVSCSVQNLTTYPNFTKISGHLIRRYKSYYIDISFNELTTIPSGVFSNFESANTNDTWIYFEFLTNKISFIENGAFIGVNNMDMEINLSENRITALPLAFQLLTNLHVLYIADNPILAFDSATVNSMAKSLIHLDIDFHALLLGNKELSVLNITQLVIFNFPSDFRNPSFNLGFRDTLSEITIYYKDTSTTLPCTLIDGPDMKHFSTKEACNISANSVFDCQPGTNLKIFTLEIISSGLEEFPDILKFTPSLRALSLSENKISSVNEKFIPLHNKLEVLNLSHNQLRTISAVFSRFDNLKMLYIENNLITSVAAESNILSVPSVCAEGNPWKHDGLYCDKIYGEHSSYFLIDNTTVIPPKP